MNLGIATSVDTLYLASDVILDSRCALIWYLRCNTYVVAHSVVCFDMLNSLS